GPAANQYTVNLTGVDNIQYLVVTLNNVNNGGNVVSPQIGFLLGDVTGNAVVSNTDVGQVKGQVNPSTPVIASNFKDDISCNGFVTNTDVGTTKAQVGTMLP